MTGDSKPKQLLHLVFGGELSRIGLHWEDIDEDISVAGLLAGRGDMTKKAEHAV